MEKVNKRKTEKVKKIEDKVIEQIAQVLVFIAKEIYQQEKELNMPSKIFSSAFSFNLKNYGNKNSRNRVCANESK